MEQQTLTRRKMLTLISTPVALAGSGVFTREAMPRRSGISSETFKLAVSTSPSAFTPPPPEVTASTPGTTTGRQSASGMRDIGAVPTAIGEQTTPTITNRVRSWKCTSNATERRRSTTTDIPGGAAIDIDTMATVPRIGTGIVGAGGVAATIAVGVEATETNAGAGVGDVPVHGRSHVQHLSRRRSRQDLFEESG